MKPTNCNTVTMNTIRQLGLVAGLLLFINGVMAQDVFEDRQVSVDSATSYLQVDVSDSLVTLKVHDVGVRDVLDEIARQSDLTVVSHNPLDGRLTLELERLPLSEALRRIMRDQSYLLYLAQAVTGVRNANHGVRAPCGSSPMDQRMTPVMRELPVSLCGRSRPQSRCCNRN